MALLQEQVMAILKTAFSAHLRAFTYRRKFKRGGSPPAPVQPFQRQKKRIFFSSVSGTLFEINNPVGNCPEHRYCLLGLVEFPALSINPIVIL